MVIVLELNLDAWWSPGTNLVKKNNFGLYGMLNLVIVEYLWGKREYHPAADHFIMCYLFKTMKKGLGALFGFDTLCYSVGSPEHCAQCKTFNTRALSAY